jgi:hypothetical protein
MSWLAARKALETPTSLLPICFWTPANWENRDA